LKTAHIKRDVARKQLASGIDRAEVRKASKTSRENSFEAIAREWFAKFKPNWVDAHAARIIRRLERDIFP
jgi:hypothetical protein